MFCRHSGLQRHSNRTRRPRAGGIRAVVLLEHMERARKIEAVGCMQRVCIVYVREERAKEGTLREIRVGRMTAGRMGPSTGGSFQALWYASCPSAKHRQTGVCYRTGLDYRGYFPFRLKLAEKCVKEAYIRPSFKAIQRFCRVCKVPSPATLSSW